MTGFVYTGNNVEMTLMHKMQVCVAAHDRGRTVVIGQTVDFCRVFVPPFIIALKYTSSYRCRPLYLQQCYSIHYEQLL